GVDEADQGVAPAAEKPEPAEGGREAAPAATEAARKESGRWRQERRVRRRPGQAVEEDDARRRRQLAVRFRAAGRGGLRPAAPLASGAPPIPPSRRSAPRSPG